MCSSDLPSTSCAPSPSVMQKGTASHSPNWHVAGPSMCACRTRSPAQLKRESAQVWPWGPAAQPAVVRPFEREGERRQSFGTHCACGCISWVWSAAKSHVTVTLSLCVGANQ